jgi:hypothetical protein
MDRVSGRGRQLTVVGVLAIVAVVFAAQGWLRKQAPPPPTAVPAEGMIHLYVDGAFRANLDPAVVMALPKDSFSDVEEGKLQEGPRLQDVVLLHLEASELSAASVIQVQGIRPQGAEPKSASVTWEQTMDADNHVTLDVSGSGDRLKLVSLLPELDTREEWVQGVSRIDIATKPTH